MTAGNREKRYIGRTDEPLCGEGEARLRSVLYPMPELVVASPMKRCRQTAEILFKNVETIQVDDLRECDFGDFEGKNHAELCENTDYRRWMESGGREAFPGGEDPDGFKSRCVSAFKYAVEKHSGHEYIAFVVHGGTIMAILEELAVPKRNFYDYHVDNGCGYMTEYADGGLRILNTE